MSYKTTHNFLINIIKKTSIPVIESKKINSHKIIQTLKNSTGPCMKALSYIIQNFIDLNLKFIKKIELLNEKGNNGIIYRIFLFDKIPFVLKKNDKKEVYPSLLKEYVIGILSINKLRYILPTFLYTFAWFNKKESLENKDKIELPGIIYEEIKGNELRELLIENKITFEVWLIIFTELLISLEVAQGEIKFCHFDLHPGNLIINFSEKSEYLVNIDTKTYNIRTNHKISIIDFGLSSVCYDDFSIGNFGYENLGITNYMIPGFDVFHFLKTSTYWFLKCKSDMEKLKKIYDFYEDIIIDVNTPYVETWQKLNYLNISLSKIGTITPQLMLNHLMITFPDILRDKFIITNRQNYKIIQYSNFIKTYYDIYDKKLQGVLKSIEIIDKCFSEESLGGYVTIAYLINVLINYNNTICNEEINNKIIFFQQKLSLNEALIEIDNFFLNKVFHISLPTQKYLNKIVSNILNIKLNNKNPDLKLENIDLMEKAIEWSEKYKFYLDYYYTIVELNLQHKFKEWIQKLKQSEIWSFYEFNIIKINQIKKWSYSLKNSIKI
mgnify:CR=1 FL=1|tara:strand:+ start:5742 stop:7397 length:1656 start_codon:yes stop_codon:yes gene_type:complete